MEDSFSSRYKFELDPFQKEAISSLSRERSVLVVAPTGSGKTLVAEFGAFKALSEGTKAFYTTPLKALSNQKFRDFREQYGTQEVGLLTGDNSINPESPLVVMTTEVLRNMIYEASPLLDRISLVVLDECHYIHDPYRGAVWEEIIINLPTQVKLVALSATVSNSDEVGDWMNKVRGDVDVLVTTERPVPLRLFYFVGHSLASLFSKGLPKRISDYHLAAQKIKGRGGRHGGRKKGIRLVPRRTEVIGQLEKKDFLPAIYFIFSRAGCERAVEYCMEDRLDLTSTGEKRYIRDFVDEKVSSMDREDLDCLGFSSWRSNLVAGVAAHHAGVIPIFKSIIEELFSRGAIKVVFATETFSLGINMPARTVVIESLTKFSGTEHRVLNPGEFTQLSGRAGRRGIDTVGNGVILYQRDYPLKMVRSLARREASPLVSSFQVSYNMAVNLLSRLDKESSVRVLNLSFAQFAADREVVSLERRREVLQEQHDRMLEKATCADGGYAVSYRGQNETINRLRRKLERIRRERLKSEIARVMGELKAGDVFEWVSRSQRRMVVMVRRTRASGGEVRLTVVDTNGKFRKVSLRNLIEAPQVLGRVDPNRISSPSKKVRKSVISQISSMERKDRGQAGLQEKSERERELEAELEVQLENLGKHMCRECEHRERCSEAAKGVLKLRRGIKKVSREIEESSGVVSRHFNKVLKVLETLGYLEGEKLTDLGRTLCKIYSECDLLLVEALRCEALVGLEPEELASYCSWFVYESRGNSKETRRRAARKVGEEFPTHGLYQAYLKTEELREKIEALENRRGMKMLGTIDIGFGSLCYRWARWEELGDLLDGFPDQSPGDMVRSMKQVIDLLRQLEEAVDDRGLSGRLRDAMRLIDRGVVAFDFLSTL